MKRILPLFFAVILLFAGCEQEKPPVQVTPEQYITDIYSLLSQEEIPLNKIYNSYFSTLSKKFISVEKYTDIETKKLDGIKITEVSDLSSSKLDDEKYKVTGTLNYVENGAEKRKAFSEYLILENGSLKYLYKGIFNRETYVMPEDVSTLPFHMNSASIYTSADGLTIEIVMENSGSTAYSVGKDGLNGEITVQTADGSFSGEISEVSRVLREETAVFRCKISDVKGKPEMITLSHIFSVNFLGNIIDTGNGFSYTVQLSDFVTKPETTNPQGGEIGA